MKEGLGRVYPRLALGECGSDYPYIVPSINFLRCLFAQRGTRGSMILLLSSPTVHIEVERKTGHEPRHSNHETRSDLDRGTQFWTMIQGGFCCWIVDNYRRSRVPLGIRHICLVGVLVIALGYNCGRCSSTYVFSHVFLKNILFSNIRWYIALIDRVETDTNIAGKDTHLHILPLSNRKCGSRERNWKLELSNYLPSSQPHHSLPIFNLKAWRVCRESWTHDTRGRR